MTFESFSNRDSMTYPTIEEVEQADHEQICRWHRFLPRPGDNAVDDVNFREILDTQYGIMDLIEQKFKDGGGFTEELSIKIGWKR